MNKYINVECVCVRATAINSQVSRRYKQTIFPLRTKAIWHQVKFLFYLYFIADEIDECPFISFKIYAHFSVSGICVCLCACGMQKYAYISLFLPVLSVARFVHSEQFTMRRMNIHIWRETAHMLKQLVTALENAGKKIVAATTSKKKLAPTRTQTLKCIIKHHQWQILIIVYKTQQHLQWPISSKHVDRNRTENWDE